MQRLTCLSPIASIAAFPALAPPKKGAPSGRGAWTLDASFYYYQKKFETLQHIPMPEHWGGFMLIPSTIEFWQGRENRLNDRLLFTKEDGKWNLSRLSP